MSKNRQIALVAVAILHVLLGYAIVSGFAISVVKKIVEPLEAVNVKEEAPPPDEPPPDDPPPPPPLDELLEGGDEARAVALLRPAARAALMANGVLKLLRLWYQLG